MQDWERYPLFLLSSLLMQGWERYLLFFIIFAVNAGLGNISFIFNACPCFLLRLQNQAIHVTLIHAVILENVVIDQKQIMGLFVNVILASMERIVTTVNEQIIWPIGTSFFGWNHLFL